MRSVQQGLCLWFGKTRDVRMKINIKPISTTFNLREPHLDRCGTCARSEFHALRDQLYRIVKTCTIPKRKKLLGIYAFFLTTGGD